MEIITSREQTIVKSTTIKINDTGLIGLLKDMGIIPESVKNPLIRIYKTNGEYYDISNDFPITIHYDEIETKVLK